ncbi:MAG: TRIC cation channel family protein [Actinobacteria bacterium]|nr:TRIC cation channel family protein [Actinomycetota bacterium]MBU1943944.1 TRIC cation channel family protein [Actinomycetota bacterium]MBU2686968.1 TRIC cation channel family protein [Actinomycetota bacterium]
MLKGQFVLPVWLDYTAAFLFAITGGLVAFEKDYDLTGLAAMALAVGLGGGIIRDGIFLQQIPAAVEDWRYLAAVLAAVVITLTLGNFIEKRLGLVILLADAMGLGLYAVVGAQKSIFLGLSVYAAGLIGLVNAVGGGLLRDVLSREDPIVFRPGQLYGVVAIVGVTVFLALGVGFRTPAWVAAVVCIAVTFVLRVVTIRFDIHTHPVHAHAVRGAVVSGYRGLAGRLRDKDKPEETPETEPEEPPGP